MKKRKQVNINRLKRLEEKSKWTIEMLITEALKFETRNEFKKGCPGAYDRARKLKIMDDICGHMIAQRTSWTMNKLKVEALRYNYRGDFQLGSPKAYDRARKLGLLDEICSHMKSKHTERTNANLAIEAKKYKSKTEFKQMSPYSYRLACKRGILKNICTHMTSQRKSWDMSLISREARLCDTRNEFRKKFSSAYHAAIRLNILDKVCVHMKKEGSRYERAIYMIKFSDSNAFYVGLTYDIQKRIGSHRVESSNKHVQKLFTENENHEIHILTDYIDIERACIAEEFYRKKYIAEGLSCLNIMPTGALGGSPYKWDTKAKIIHEATKYKTRTDFKVNSAGAYDAALKFCIMEDACAHMIVLQKVRANDEIHSVAMQYGEISEFIKHNKNVYMTARRRGILDEVSSHMTKKKRPRYSDEEFILNAKNYETKSQFRIGCPGVYSAAHKRGIFNNIWRESRPNIS